MGNDLQSRRQPPRTTLSRSEASEEGDLAHFMNLEVRFERDDSDFRPAQLPHTDIEDRSHRHF
jgi:hypothetical protein